MGLKFLLVVFGVLHILFPQRFIDFWVRLMVADPNDVEIRPWVYSAARVEGVVWIALGAYLWRRDRESVPANSGITGVESIRDKTAPPTSQTEESAPRESPVESDRSEAGSAEPDSDRSVEEIRADRRADDDLPSITPGTRRWTLASVLSHADGYLTVAEIVDLLEGTDWELTNSNASAALYTMYRDYAVHRRNRGGDGSYEYWLTDDAERVIEQHDEPLEPNPFE